MKQNEIFEVMSRFDKSGISRLEYEQNGERLVLEKAMNLPVMPLAQPAEIIAPIQPMLQKQNESANNVQGINAPLVGVFYAQSAPGEPALAKVGDRVEKGQLLCLIEAMKMINELPSPVSGIIKEICVNNEDVVSFGQKLFEVEPC